MQKIISVLLVFVSFFTAHFAQIEIRLNPAKYNLVDPDVSALPAPVEEPAADDFVQLSEVKMHYLVYGDGEQPLILIHGNGGSANSLKSIAQLLANRYTVYVIESRCHGQSSDPGAITYELMARDVAEFAQALGLEKPILMGHSDGGMVTLAAAANDPDLPGAIISCGSNSKPSGFWPYFPAGVFIKNVFQHDKLNDLMLYEPDFTAEYLGRITCPAYIVCGEYDIMKLTDHLFIHESVPGSDMAVVKGADHGNYMRDGRAYVLAMDWLTAQGL